VPWRDATTHVLTHSLHYGLAVVEGVRAYKTVDGTAIFRVKEHTERLFNSGHRAVPRLPGQDRLRQAFAPADPGQVNRRHENKARAIGPRS